MNRNAKPRPVVAQGMLQRTYLRYAGIYLAVELAAAALLIWAIGLGWTMVVVAVTSLLGLALAASQVRGQVGALRRRRSAPQGAVADGALVGLGSFLVFLPGVVSTAVGALMLTPRTRAAMRPAAAAMINRGLYRRVESLSFARFAGVRPARRDYIDGEVIDVNPAGGTVRRLPARR